MEAEISLKHIVSMEARKGNEHPEADDQLGAAIEYRTAHGVAVVFYTATVKNELYSTVGEGIRPVTLKFQEQEDLSWNLLVGFSSTSESLKVEFSAEEVQRFFEELGIKLPR